MPSKLKEGLHCKACDSPLSTLDDPELCTSCMAVVFQYNRKLLEEVDEAEVMDIELMLEYEEE